MPAPAIVNSTTGAFTNNTTATCNLPGSLVVGNLLIAWIEAAAGTKAITTPSGFTQILGCTNGNINLAYRIIDGTEGSSITWTYPNTPTTSGTTGVVQISGARTTNPIGAFSTYTSLDPGQSVSTLIAQQIKTAGADSMIFALLNITSAGNPVLPANYTNIVTAINAGVSTRACYETLGTAYTLSDPISMGTGSPAPHWETAIVEILSAAPVPPLQEILFGGGAQAWTANNAGTSPNTGVLPPSVSSDLFIGAIFSATAGVIFTWPAGWTAFASVSGAGAMAASFAYALGSASAPAVTVSGGNASLLCITAIRNVPTGSPIGAFNVNGNTGTTASCLAITTERNNSLVLGLIANAINGAAVPSSGYVQSAAAAAGANQAAIQMGWEFRQTAGSTSDPISVAVSNGLWATAIIEIPGFASGHSFGTIMG